MYFLGKRLYFVLFFAVLIAGLFFVGISIKNIKNGFLLSEPINLKICADFKNDNDLQVYRITRTNAEFALIPQNLLNCKIFENKEWFKEIKIVANNRILDSLSDIKLQIGKQEWSFKPDQLNKFLVTFKDQTSLLIIDSHIVNHNVSSISIFSNLINWPGDLNLVWRCLKNGILKFISIFLICLILIFLLDWWSKKSKEKYSLISSSQLRKTSEFYKYFFAGILSIISLIIFIKNGPTAYDWPAMDMGPFFARHADSNFAINDYFTNSSSQPTPRFVFGYLIIGIKNILFTDWYSALFLLKIVLIIFMPPVIFLALGNIFAGIENERKKIVLYLFLFIFVGMAFSHTITYYFTIALWTLFEITPTAQCLSIFTGFTTIYLNSLVSYKKIIPFNWLFASLLHPAMGLFLLIFFFVINFQKTTKKEYFIYLLSGVVIPFFIIFLLFSPKIRLSAVDFTYHYIIANHSFHYLPSYFTSSISNPLPWYFSFIFINILFIVSLLLGYFKNDKFLKIISLFSLVTYTGSLVLGYLFVELYPIKIISIIGPVRYSMFGYWLLVIIYAYIISDLYEYFSFLFRKIQFNLKKINYLVIISLTILSITLVFFGYKDDPFQNARNNNVKLYNWVETNTKPDQIFVSNIHDLLVNLPLVANRPVFTGNGFPFREDDFIEYNSRRFLVFGSPEDWKKNDDGAWDGIKINSFYRSLGPADFVRVSFHYPLDYVIIEKDFSSQFDEFLPVYQDDKVKIYKINDLKNKKI